MADMPKLRTALVAAAALLSAGCATHREFRVAEIGSDGSFEIAGDEDSSIGTAPFGGKSPLVASGNLLIGSGSQSVLLGGTVVGTLESTSQTVVQLASGTSLLLNGIGGTLGDVVAIDPSIGRVVGGPVSLVGASVLGSSGGTQLAGGGSRGGSLVSVGGRNSPTSAVGAVARGTQTLVSGTSATGRVTGTVTNTATGAVNTALGRPCC